MTPSGPPLPPDSRAFLGPSPASIHDMDTVKRKFPLTHFLLPEGISGSREELLFALLEVFFLSVYSPPPFFFSLKSGIGPQALFSFRCQTFRRRGKNFSPLAVGCFRCSTAADTVLSFPFRMVPPPIFLKECPSDSEHGKT